MTDPLQTFDDYYLLEETSELLAIEWTKPKLTREFWNLPDGSVISSVRWLDGEPALVFLHGGGQNAHTWDAIGLLMNRPFVAFDLPGHGHSSWRADKEYRPKPNAESIAWVLDAMGLESAHLVGMSLGGLTALHLAAIRPRLFTSVLLVDVTPSQMEHMKDRTPEERGTTALIQGPESYPTLQSMIDAATALAPTRPPLLVERGVVHNSRQLEDGSWAWRYDTMRNPSGKGTTEAAGKVFMDLWEDLDSIEVPVLLITGGASVSVAPEHRAEFLKRAKYGRAETIAGAGHSVQSDRPAELAKAIAKHIA